MLTILIFIAVLVFLVVVHEMGHFGVAKLTGVRVLEFGVGFPPRLLGIRRGDTVYSLNILPLGGFVRLAGEEDPHEPGSLANRSALVRVAVLAAGSVMNAILPILLLTIFFMTPQNVPATDVVILEVSEGSPAQVAGILPGDVVREVHGREVRNSGDLRAAIQLRLGANSDWVLERGDRLLQVSLTPRVKPPADEGSAGVLPIDARVSVEAVEFGSTSDQAGLRRADLLVTVGGSTVLFMESPALAVEAARAEAPGEPVPVVVLRGGALVELTLPATAAELGGLELAVRPEVRESKPLWRAVPASLGQMWDILVMFRNEVSRWISGVRPDVAGPIGIAQLTGEVARSGISPLLFWTALLSMNLAIINLLPIPALDGGRIAFVLLELARGGRRLSPERERLVHLIGFAVLMALILAVSIGDIQRIIGGGGIVGP